MFNGILKPNSNLIKYECQTISASRIFNLFQIDRTGNTLASLSSST